MSEACEGCSSACASPEALDRRERAGPLEQGLVDFGNRGEDVGVVFGEVALELFEAWVGAAHGASVAVVSVGG